MNTYTRPNTLELKPLSAEELMRRAPAVFAEEPSADVSKKYRQVKSTQVIDILQDRGWSPVSAMQTRARTPEGREVTKHMVRFAILDQQKELRVGDNVIQAVLTNSHNRTSAFVFRLGVFRLACSNGMMVAESSFASIHVRHVGFNPAQIIRASAKIVESGKDLADRINEMKAIPLEPAEQLALARASVPLLLPAEEGLIEPERLLVPRRYSDRDDMGNLWTTFNVIQENAIKGGVRVLRRDDEKGNIVQPFVTPTGRRVNVRYRQDSLRQVRNIDRDCRVNQGLWTLVEEMRKIKAGKIGAAELN